MANLSVTCPNCGSSKCQEYRADSFVCFHCDTTFRWVDPNRITVRHESQTCQCGRKQIGACTQCRTDVCRDHVTTWKTLFDCWQSLKMAYVDGLPDVQIAAWKPGGMAACDLRRPTGWLQSSKTGTFLNGAYRQQSTFCNIDGEELELIRSELGNVVGKNEDLLCLACAESCFVKLLRPVEAAVQNLIAQHKLCEVKSEYCAMKIVSIPRGFCAMCRVPVAPIWDEGGECDGCGKMWCKTHSTVQDKLCRSCQPSLLKRLFS